MSYTYVNDHREYLIREYKNRLNRRPYYSQRAFARDIGVSASTLTDFFKDRIGFSAARAKQIAKKISLTQEQASHWIDLNVYRFSRNQIKKKESILKIKSRIKTEKNAISIDEFKIISEWEHFAFLELIQMDSQKYSNIKYSASRLGISQSKLKECILRLIKLNLITETETDYQVHPETYVGNTTSSDAIKFFHNQIIKKAQIALETQQISERYNSSTFIAISKDQVELLIENLKKSPSLLLDKYVEENNNKKTDELYCLSIQFFNLLNTIESKL